MRAFSVRNGEKDKNLERESKEDLSYLILKTSKNFFF